MKKKVLFCFGTRPEAIKLAPLIKLIQKYPDRFESKILLTGQHTDLVYQVLDFFEIKYDYDLEIMQPNQSLIDITTKALIGINSILIKFKPDIIIVQGDTSTVFIASLAAFYNRIKVAHIEAGLRSYKRYSPFPEEINRILTSKLANIHFAPTEKASENLLKEGIDSKSIFVVKNTVIDALYLALDILGEDSQYKTIESHFKGIDFSKKIIMITSHRRESFGEPIKNIFTAIKTLSNDLKNFEFVIPIHPNPNVRNTAISLLNGIDNVHIIEPLDYPKIVWLMNKSHLILTDSGGIQEEAPSLKKPVLVLRDVTERTEGILSGNAKLVGTNITKIIDTVKLVLNDQQVYKSMIKNENPYGDGKASERIIDYLLKFEFDE